MKKAFVILGKIVAGVVAVCSATVVVWSYMSKKSKELETKNEGQKVKKYQILMDGKEEKICQEEIEDIEATCTMGGFDLDLTQSYIVKDVKIKVKCYMGGVRIFVPPMVHVVLVDDVTIMGGTANLVPTYEKEELPTIYISVKNIMGGVSVQMQP